MNDIPHIQISSMQPDDRGRERRLRIALAIGTGLLFALAFPPVPTGLTAFVAFIPLLFLIERLDSSAAVFRYSYLAFLVGNAGTIWWISGWWGEDPWLKAAGVAVNLIHPLLFTPPLVLYHIIRRRTGFGAAAAVFPFLWTAWEWLMHLPELSFPWLTLANTQTYDIMNIQFISWTGSFGLTFWILLVTVLIFIPTRQLLRGRWVLHSKRMYLTGAALVLLLVLPKIHSAVLMNDPVPVKDTIRVGIIQPDIDPYDKWGEGETAMQKLRNLIDVYDSLAAHGPDIILLPETAIPFRILQPSFEAEWRWLRAHIDSVGVTLLAGFPHTVLYENAETAPTSARRIPDSELHWLDFNSAMLIEADEPLPQIYHKSRLTPLSERIPYLDAMPFLHDALTWGVGISNWGLGNDTTVFRLRHGGVAYGFWAMICYETLYPSFVAGFAGRGAEAFGVITNDGWFGKSSGPYQLKQYTVLRAVENRRAVARCANNGISCFIDPYGRVRQETELYTRTGIIGLVPLIDEQTFYTRHGDWLPLGTVVVAGFFILFAIIAPYYRT